MNYAEALEQLNAMTPELHIPAGQPRRKFSLDEMRTLMAALGDPQKRFQSVLIAGTNGKGSTAATLASIITASGSPAGLYTSPHLVRPNERIKIKRQEISDEDFARLFAQVFAAGQELLAAGQLPQPPSFFETLTAMAFLYFAEKEVKFVVLEAGMGGRLDATNIVEPLLSIITDISLDHTEWLGATLGEIAREKAGILRPGGVLVKLPQNPEVGTVLEQVAKELGVTVVDASPYLPTESPTGPYPIEALGRTIRIGSPLDGDHQLRNVALAVAAALELGARHGLEVLETSLSSGVRWTYWPGRYEKFAAFRVEWILDIAHNAAAAQALLHRLMSPGKRDRQPRTLLFACLKDKALAEMSKILFPIFDNIIFAPLDSPRAAPLAELEQAARDLGLKSISASSISEAVQKATELSSDGPVVVTGSSYLVGQVRPILVEEKLP